MKLYLDNVMKITDDKVKIAQLKALGYCEVGKEKGLEDLTKEELIALARKKGLEVTEKGLEVTEAEKGKAADDGETKSYHELNKDELMAELDKAGKEYKKTATKDELIALLENE